MCSILVILIGFYVVDVVIIRKQSTRLPLSSKIEGLVPRFILNLIFAHKAAELLQRRCNKFQDLAFQLIRNDGNIIILPSLLLDELAALPVTIANPHAALERDLLGHYTGLNLILENRLHHMIVQRKLTPKIPLLIPRLEKVVADAFNEYFPTSEEWIEFEPYQALGQISTRIAAEVIVGPKFCENQVWLNIALNYTENLFRTIVVLRLFPSWTHSLLCFLLPSYWKGKKVLRMAKQLLGPRIQEIINQSDAGTWEPQDSNADDINVLCWLSFMAKGRDRNPDTIAHVLVLVALGAVHTTLLRMVNVLYDVTAAGPNLLKELLDEIRSVVDKGWTGAFSYDKLYRLDSVICESQRLSPPTILGMKRLFRESYTFQDGTYISSGSYVCMSIHAIENDKKYTPCPEHFDGLRNFRARQERQSFDNAEKISDKLFLFSTPTRTAISFGYGKSACPGRFFASYVIKMVVVKMLIEYEFSFLPGTKRPVNIMIHEFLFTWPWQKMLIRRKAMRTV